MPNKPVSRKAKRFKCPVPDCNWVGVRPELNHLQRKHGMSPEEAKDFAKANMIP